MPKKNFLDEDIEKQKIKLGKLIRKCRGTRSLRKAVEGTILSASNLQLIERGVNAPTADAYESIVKKFSPNSKIKADMDECYMAIRKTPPPDVCKTILDTKGLVAALRKFDEKPLTESQMEKLSSLLSSFIEENKKGEPNHAENL